MFHAHIPQRTYTNILYEIVLDKIKINNIFHVGVSN